MNQMYRGFIITQKNRCYVYHRSRPNRLVWSDPDINLCKAWIDKQYANGTISNLIEDMKTEAWLESLAPDKFQGPSIEEAFNYIKKECPDLMPALLDLFPQAFDATGNLKDSGAFSEVKFDGAKSMLVYDRHYKIDLFKGRPNRETVISNDDILNLQIALNASKSFDSFLASV